MASMAVSARADEVERHLGTPSAVAAPSGTWPVPPLVERIAFKADDPESVLARLPDRWGDRVMVPHSRGPIGYSLRALASHRLFVGEVSCCVARTSRLSLAHPLLQVPLDCTARYRIGRKTFTVGPGTPMLIAPGHECTASFSAGSVLCIQLDTAMLFGMLPAGRAGRPRHWTVQSVPLEALQGDGIDFPVGIEALLRASAAPGSVDWSADFAALEGRLVSWLTSSLLDRGALRCSVPAGVALAESAGKWIEANLARSITLDTLADQFGVTGRWLQRCFSERWGQTPMEFVTSRRLAVARAKLASKGAPSVTSAALQSGFSHLGRFASHYRRLYGESPSATLARAMACRQRHVQLAGCTETQR
jgi:AraC-like DNA-binding protein